MNILQTYPTFKYSVVALLLGASLALAGIVLTYPVNTSSQQASVALAEELPVSANPPAPEVFPYVEIQESCNHESTGSCARVYSTPSMHAPTLQTLRTGIVLRVGDIVQNEGGIWYKVIFDEWVRYPNRVSDTWYIAQKDARLFFDTGIQELTTETPKTKKYIVVNRSNQTLLAYDNETLFMDTRISTGLLLTPTPRGTFSIYKKTPSRYMQGPLPGISDQYYDLPGVPWTLYFTEQGGAIHGAYWHNKFGQRWSHGCVNVSLDDAERLYRWADIGTTVYVRD